MVLHWAISEAWVQILASCPVRFLFNGLLNPHEGEFHHLYTESKFSSWRVFVAMLSCKCKCKGRMFGTVLGA